MRKCIVCNGKDYVHDYFCVDDIRYNRCDQCGLIFVDQIAPWNTLYKSYTGGFWKSLRRKLVLPLRSFNQVKNRQKSQQRANQIIEFIESSFDHDQPNITFLDVGCNKGFLLEAGIRKFWNVYGTEVVSELLVPFKKKYPRFKDQVLAKKLVDAQGQYADNMFDVVSAVDVIEHFEDPVNDLKIINRILATGGLFVIQTPDGGSEQAKTMKDKWGALKPLEHLYIFNQGNLKILSQAIGFRQISFSAPFEEADGNLVAMLRK